MRFFTRGRGEKQLLAFGCDLSHNGTFILFKESCVNRTGKTKRSEK